jgi:hypothetical protein
MKLAVLAASGILLLMSANNSRGATNVVDVLVQELSLNRQLGNIVFVRVSQAPSSGSPSCAINTYWHYTVPLNDEMGKNIYAALLAALMAHTPVSIAGVGACQEYGNVETLAALNPKP